MADKGAPASIADSTGPNAGGHNDFLPGENHEVVMDRIAAPGVILEK
jgi:hypothetical protein